MVLMLSTLFPSGVTLLDLVATIIVLVLVWIIVSIPAYVAGKVVTGGRASFGEAMAATLLGPIVYIIVLVGVDFFLGWLIGGGGYIAGFALAFVAWIWVYKATFKTGWLGAFAIAILAIIMFVVLLFIVGVLFGFLPQLVPTPSFPRL
jgi:hypothetical protein